MKSRIRNRGDGAELPVKRMEKTSRPGADNLDNLVAQSGLVYTTLHLSVSVCALRLVASGHRVRH